jgi:transposase-like protein
MKCKRSSDARAHDHHTLQVMRQQAVKVVRHGETADSVSKAMGVNIRTVFRWLADFSMGWHPRLRRAP